MRGSTHVSKHRSHGTPGPKSQSMSRATQRSTPARPLTGIWPVSMRIRLLCKLSFRALTLLAVRTPIGRFYLGHAIQTRSPRSESISPVERPSSCDTGHYARLATKGSVQQSSVDQPVYSEHAPVTPGPGTGIQDPVPGPGTRCSVQPNTPGKQGTVTTSGRPITPGKPGSTVKPGDSVRPVHSGQKAQLEKADQGLDQSELSVLYSPGRLVQLEHNVHEQPGNMPNLQSEHLSEHSNVFKTLQSLTVRMSEQIILLNELICKILDFGLWASVTPSTLWAPVTLVTVQTVSIQSADLGRLGLMLWSMGQTELDIVLISLVLHGEIVSHIVNLSPSVTLTQVNFLQLR